MGSPPLLFDSLKVLYRPNKQLRKFPRRNSTLPIGEALTGERPGEFWKYRAGNPIIAKIEEHPS